MIKTVVIGIFIFSIVGESTAQLNARWSKTLKAGPGSELTGLLYHSGFIYTTSLDATIYKFDTEGKAKSTYAASPNLWINNAQIIGNSVYGFGSGILQWDLNLNFQKQINLKHSIFKAAALNNQLYSAENFKRIRKNNFLGNEIWTTQVAASAFNEKLLIADNHIYLYSVIYEPAGSGGILKYDTLGNLVWQVDPGLFVRNIVTDNAGNCYILGAKIDGACYVKKLSKSGDELWETSIPSFYARNGKVKGDTIFICGTSFVQKDSLPELTDEEWESGVALLSMKNGQILSLNHYNLFEYQHEELTHLDVGHDEIYAGGFYSAGGVAASFVVQLSDERQVSIQEQNTKQPLIIVFPNPAEEKVTVNLLNIPSHVENVRYLLYDQLGRQITIMSNKYVDLQNKIIITAPGTPGIYLLKISLDDHLEFTRKIIFK